MVIAGVDFDVEVTVERREDYFAARTNPFAITAYGRSKGKATERALDAVKFLLRQYSKTQEQLCAYLDRRGVVYIYA